MTGKQRRCILCAVFGVLCLLCGCGKTSGTSENFSIDFTDQEGAFAFFNGKVITFEVGDDTRPRSECERWYAVDPETMEETELGYIPDWLYGVAHDTEMSGKLYTFYTAWDESLEDYSTTCFEIGSEPSSVRSVASYGDEVSPMVYSWATPEGLLQLKTPREDSGLTTYFDLLHPDTGESKLVLQAPENDFFGHASVYHDTLYVLTFHDDPDGSSEWVLQSYELGSYRLLGEISLDIIDAYINDSRISNMEVFGDYVYFLNYSDHGIIVKISEEGAEPVVKRDFLYCASWWNRPEDRNERLFYIRYESSGECFTFQPDTGELRSFHTKLMDDYKLIDIQVDGNRVMVERHKWIDSGRNKIFLDFYDYEDFIRQGDGAAE